ncbi:MAG: bifunctional methylenetetrahydrofolate dehydrogenase/methenyltetrahydrofolate cyclohydrolase FolD [Defluviitaleaceae bacterium]|nr:bifunctional methylenetetrahydrofolate dehydrogenase/methenyltetrahydrofolate cyclohydrolase FolD [Defluviitaleaceae bacterium]
MAIIDGKAHAAAIRQEVKTQAASGANAHLVVVLVGEDPASKVYIRGKEKACAEVGFKSTLISMPETSTQEEVLAVIEKLNKDPDVTGILVQQPFPAHLDKNKIVSFVAPEKDVDCLGPCNVGLAAMGQGKLLQCTPSGVIGLLERENIEIAGKHAVVIGRSDIVGKPLALMLLAKDATVTICHSRTKNLAEVCRRADILVAAVGRARLVTADFVKPGAVVIDVGMNRNEKKLCGDVDYDAVKDIASYITPVPGGVGPMTIATLMQNCLRAWEMQK